MGDPVHLEKMGRELKCPICLSLLNSSVSLTCNHVFCNSCIVKSMKSHSNCPVCKVPYRRREIRAAPHMDNLVTIYKSMELASGFNIFVTQNPPLPQTKLSDELKQVEDNGREVSDHIFHEKGGSQPSFPANKRVQVPHSSIPGKPTRSEKQQIENGVKIKDGSKNSSLAHLKDLALNDKGERVLSPFFWLQEENDDKLSQLSEGDQFLVITPPHVPTFSDIKDSDDEIPSSSANGGEHGEANVVDLLDSEMFEWTQRPCSPELYTSPVKVQKQDNNRTARIQGQKSDVPFTSEVFHSCSEEFSLDDEKSMNMKQRSGDEELLAVSGAKSTKNQIERKKLNKTNGKTKEATLRKCAKKNADQDFKAPVESPEECGNAVQKEDNDCSLNLEKTRKRTKKAGPITSAIEPKPKKVRFLSDKANMEEITMVSELPGPSNMQRGDKKDIKTGKPCRKNISEPHRNGSLRSKKRKVEFTDVQKTEKADANQSQINKDRNPGVPFPSVSLVDDQNLPHTDKPSSDGAHSKKGVAQKGLRNIQAKDSETSQKFRSSTKEIQPIEKINDSVGVTGLDNLTSLRKLQEGNSLHRFKCAFCLSPEDSEVSGEMVRYCDGRLVGANHDNGSKVIHCHKNCAEWAPNVYFEDDTAFNLEAELARSRRIKCCCCGEKGAALGCYEKSCRKSFHVPCAKQIPQCRWDTQNFVILCPLHVSSKLPNETTESVEKRKRCVSTRQTQRQCNEILKPNTKIPQKSNSIATRGKMVLCCSALTPEERAAISEFERLSGVTVLKNWESSVTHVIASTDENGACKRTLKVLMGILEGKWVLNMEWVRASMKAMKTVEEKQYEITVDIHGIRNGPKHGRQRLLNKQPKIFEGVEFYFIGDFVASYKGYIQDLVVAGGGIILHRKPISTALEAPSPTSSKQTYIVYSLELPGNFDSQKKNMILNRRKTDAEALASSTGAKAVSNSWVLNSIAACKLMRFPE